eukprot:GFKZ01014958.1.p1 GENE.GFKZ01014958.1~~GFKZ01014958.1.p1  ORF type:complete len:579 (-),score=83.68 GFKZ01014958.1:389-2125(-)
MASTFLSLAVLLLTLLSSLPSTSASLYWTSGGGAPRRDVTLLQFGEAVETVSVIASAGVQPVVETDSNLVEVSDPIIADVGDGNRNITYEFTFSETVGVVRYTISAVEEGKVLRGTFIVAGFVLKSDGVVVSGDAREGIRVGQQGTVELEVEVVGVDGRAVDLDGTRITPGRMDGGVYLEEVDISNTGFREERFVLAVNTLRVGTGRFSISFEVPAIEEEGEVFETVLIVTQDTSTTPPCVVDGATATVRAGVVELSMFNLLVPPRAAPVEEIILQVGERSLAFDVERSELVLPTSTVVFSGVGEGGSAVVLCDGQEAVVLENGQVVEAGLTLEVDPESVSLAKDTLVQNMPSPATGDVISSLISAVDEDPDTLTTTVATSILDEYCSTVRATGECVITNITRGSAVIGFGAAVENFEESQEALAGRFDTCAFQSATGFGCDKLRLLGNAPAVALAGGAATGGIATWTIALVSVVGAFALIAILSLSAWALHRRSAAKNSESSYSSSGPLGVPDPSDMLYEQSIVRDIYGRGPDGGLTQADADQSERLAALREEHPRPPSSGSSLSRRGSEASSTYSV